MDRDGYRALHLIVLRKGHAIEVQLRTKAQDIWAFTTRGREVIDYAVVLTG